MSYPLIETLNIMRDAPRYNAWLYSHIKVHLNGSVLDIGSGFGDIAGQFDSPTVNEVILSDHAPEMVQELERTPLPLKKYRTMCMDITDPQILAEHPAGQVDTVTCINVLEHIKDDHTALKHIKHLLKKGGKLVLLVPALPNIYGTLDTYVEHHRRYTKKNLLSVVEQAGFTVKSAYYMNMLGICTWFLAGRVLRQKRFHQKACRILDHTVPLLKTMEDFIPPPLGQSLIVVGES